MLIAVNYHYIRENFASKHPSIFGLTPFEFEEQLIAIGKEGDFVSQDDILKSLNDELTLPQKSIIITFDDGLQEQYMYAKPVLDKLGIPAIFYINPINIQEGKISTVHKIHLLRAEYGFSFIDTDLINPVDFLSSKEKFIAENHYSYDNKLTAYYKYYLNFKLSPLQQQKLVDTIFEKNLGEEELKSKDLYMNESQIKSLIDQGQIGSHSYDHLPLGCLDDDNLLQDMFSKTNDFFDERFNFKPRSISYPYGSYEACRGKVRDLAREFGYKFGFTMERAANSDVNSNSLMLSRFDCNDVVKGKNALFKAGKMFENAKQSEWRI